MSDDSTSESKIVQFPRLDTSGTIRKYQPIGTGRKRRHEITGKRDMCYSNFHHNIPDDSLACFDVDGVETCHTCYEPLAFIELTRDTGAYKASAVVRWVGFLTGKPAYVVYYTPVDEAKGLISHFRVHRVHSWTDVDAIQEMTPDEYIRFLQSLRAGHICGETKPRVIQERRIIQAARDRHRTA